MFKRILIANRGEIACRVARTCQRMGIDTIAVYSDADADALHVRMVDEAVHIGGSPAAESYLLADRIIEAAKSSGADANQPGFGFLSENASFVDAVEAAGLVFIGPGTKAIAAMGDKITSKRIAVDAGVSSVPGHMGVIETVEEAARIALEIGYPVMIKASAGGGGKGMRMARDPGELTEGFSAARSEAKSSFGDDRIFIEKFIENPRHIEIQVLADSHGNIIHLGERECSIQRRHQKVIEEAPSPFLDEATRAAMGAEAVLLARAVDYTSAGTVEFIVDKERNFYFLEMNTRLQVEHPVTEMTTGLDLVEEMIRIAAGEPLRHRQEDISFNGWALEARIYAEDPYRGFLPSIGRLTRYAPPVEDGSVRVDTGVYEGAEISLYYDPMIAKLVTHGADRDQALDRMSLALNRFQLNGIAHNIPFLAAVIGHPRFRRGELTTAFIDEEYPDGFEGAPLSEALRRAFIGVALMAHVVSAASRSSIEGQVMAQSAPQDRSWRIALGGAEYEASIQLSAAGATVRLGEDRIEIEADWRPGDPVLDGRIDGEACAIGLRRTALGFALSAGGATMHVTVLRPAIARLQALMPVHAEESGSKALTCPMPGLVLSIAVAPGDAVKAGQALAVVEAMKMENILRAERDGIVAKVVARQGSTLAVDDVILEFE